MPYELFPFQKYSDHIYPCPDLPSTSTREDHPDPEQQSKQKECYYGSSSSWKFCPVCVLPLVAVFVILFAIVQLFIIYRSIENYKIREQEFKDCYFPNEHLHHHQHETREPRSISSSSSSSSASGVVSAIMANDEDNR